MKECPKKKNMRERDEKFKKRMREKMQNRKKLRVKIF
jgi:hypothetical protein